MAKLPQKEWKQIALQKSMMEIGQDCIASISLPEEIAKLSPSLFFYFRSILRMLSTSIALIGNLGERSLILVSLTFG